MLWPHICGMKHILTVLLLVPAVIWGQVINTDRPDQTESSAVVPLGSFQWECGFSSSWESGFGGNIRSMALPNSLFRVSVLEGIELRVVHQLDRISQHSFGNDEVLTEGTSDVQLGTKIQLYQREGKKTEIAYLGHAVAPTGDAGVTEYDWGMVNKLCISHDVGPDWALGYNLGLDLVRGSSVATYAVAVGKSINDKLGLYFEPYGEYDTARGIHWASFDAGITMLASDTWQWDISYGTGLNHRMNYTAIGFSWLVLPNR